MTHLLVYGDSNSHGCLPMPAVEQAPKLPRSAAWPGLVADRLTPDWQVTIEALPGRTFVHEGPIGGPWKNGLAVLPAIVESHAPVDVFAVMLGTNDLKGQFGMTATGIALAAARFLDEARCRMPGTRILMIVPPRVRETGTLADMFRGVERRSDGLAERLAEIAGPRDVTLFDAGSVISTDPTDGVHFGAEAHAALADALLPVIRGLA